MNRFRAPLIAAAVLTMTSCAAFAQVRVIGPDSEHVYSSDPREGGLLKEGGFKRKNEPKKGGKREGEYKKTQARRQEELDAAAQAAAAGYEEQQSVQDGSYVGAFVGRQNRRHLRLRRISTTAAV